MLDSLMMSSSYLFVDGARGGHNGKGRPQPVPVPGLRTANSGNMNGSLSNLSRPNFSQSVTSLVSAMPTQTYEPLRRLSASVVAYHYCQVDNNITCTVPEFVHSLAAHLVCAPALAPYRDLLLARPRLHALLGIRQCVLNASRAFVDGILQPLTELYSSGRLPSRGLYVIVVDALNEAAFHEPDYGDTIATFLGRHLRLFPPCLRLIATTQTGSAEIGRLPLRELPLDGEMAVRDVADYVAYRVAVTSSIQSNVEPSGRLGDPVSSNVKLAAHIATLSAGSMLYARLVLDLIERGPLVLKGSGYRVVPVNLAEIYQLEMNLRFATARAFDRASPILSVCLASLYPLIADELEDAVMSRRVRGTGSGLADELRRMLELMSGLLVQRNDSTYAFFHPTFREWLMRRDDIGKFQCDVR